MADTIGKLVLIIILVGLFSCSINQRVTGQKYFNENEFTGLEQLVTGKKNILLDYELDGSDSKIVHFASCSQVMSMEEDSITPHQFKLLRLLKINCKAAKIYLNSDEFFESYFPKNFSKSFVSELPAQAVPNLGGGDLTLREGLLMGKYEKDLRFWDVSSNSFSVILTNGIEITYVILARTDINSDGVEDWIVRLDWSIPQSFGDGSDLMILSKPSEEDNIKIHWRY